MANADLHLHSSASDGRYPPREVLRRAHGVGLTAVALTDHDTVAGNAEAEKEARRLQLRFLPGCEISVSHQGMDLHLLAYFFAPPNERLQAMLAQIRAGRETRITAMLAKLKVAGMELSHADIVAEARGSSSLGRVHVARALLNAGLVASFGEAFQRLIGAGGPAYVPKLTPDPAEIIAAVWASRGVPVIAHPGSYGLEDPAGFFADWDIGGIEVGHPSHALEIRRLLGAWAQRDQLPATAGSDWHGTEDPAAYIGSCGVDEDVIDQLRARVRSDSAPPQARAEALEYPAREVDQPTPPSGEGRQRRR